MTYRCKLMKREEAAEGTMAFHFEKPRGFQFRPGQCVGLTLVNPPETDGEGNTRTFSIVSPPYEEELVFATRMRNTAFRRCFGRRVWMRMTSGARNSVGTKASACACQLKRVKRLS